MENLSKQLKLSIKSDYNFVNSFCNVSVYMKILKGIYYTVDAYYTCGMSLLGSVLFTYQL